MKRTTGIAAAIALPLSVVAAVSCTSDLEPGTAPVATTPAVSVPILVPSPGPRPSPSPPIPTLRRVRHTATKSVPRKVSTTSKAPEPKGPRTYSLYPVTAIGSQDTIDEGKLVTWFTEPTCLLAGHNNMGWAYLDNIATGSIVKVKTGPCSGTYKVVTHKWQSVKGGPVPSWMSSYDLVLQTCTTNGMGFSAANRI